MKYDFSATRLIRMILRDKIANKDCGRVKSYTSKEIIKALENDGWYEVRVAGSHHHFRHAQKAGTVTVPHPKKGLPTKTVKRIFAQAEIRIEGQS